jgi:hypothetical protein
MLYIFLIPPMCYIPCPSHCLWFDQINNIWWNVHIMKLLLPSLLQPPATSSLLGPNILLSMLFSNTLNLCSFLSVTDQVSHPYKTSGKIMAFIF